MLNVIRDNRKSWQVFLARTNDLKEDVMDVYLGHHYDHWAADMQGRGLVVEEAPNFIFEAKMKMEKDPHCLCGEPSLLRKEWNLSKKGALSIIQALQSGDLTITEGYLDGWWTISKMSTFFFITPYMG